MPGSGTSLFSDPGAYQASLPKVTKLYPTELGGFSARVTWVELRHLHLLHAREQVPRVAYMSLPPEWVFVMFPTRRTSSLLCDGALARLGNLVFHSPGERFHQKTAGATAWGSICLTPSSFQSYGRTLAGRDLSSPQFAQILRPAPSDLKRLLRLHAQAIRIAETKLNHIGHQEVAHALEQDLIWALVQCLTASDPDCDSAVSRRHAAALVRLEEVLAANRGPLPRVPELCRTLGISEQALRISCARVLGMTPARYLRLLRREQNPRATMVDRAEA
ncbi:MAG: hypothetical protein JO227_15960 [Acetobacteraceae bacterium]|nr:hypothetical protein [Acetobacteraceae bacterium]